MFLFAQLEISGETAADEEDMDEVYIAVNISGQAVRGIYAGGPC
jgi:hypothetical protein